MHILSVRVEDCKFSEETGRHQATLLMQGSQSRVSLRAAAELARAAHENDVIHELAADAIRQMKRLPEYRNTARQITLAKDALPI